MMSPESGDFGLGTFDHLDGEIYQITSDEAAARVDDDTLTPFSCVAFYQPMSHDRLDEGCSYPAFLQGVQGVKRTF